MANVGGSVSFGSNYSDDVPKKAVQAVFDAFTKATGTEVKVNTVDHNSFQENISNYLQGSPDQVFTWFAGYRMQFFAALQGAEQRLGRRVSPTLYTSEEFLSRRRAGQPFLRRVLEGKHVVLIGSEHAIVTTR